MTDKHCAVNARERTGISQRSAPSPFIYESAFGRSDGPVASHLRGGHGDDQRRVALQWPCRTRGWT